MTIGKYSFITVVILLLLGLTALLGKQQQQQDLQNFRITVQQEHALFRVDLHSPGKIQVVVSPTGEEVSIVSHATPPKLNHIITIPYLESSTEYTYSIIGQSEDGERVTLRQGSFHTPVSD